MAVAAEKVAEHLEPPVVDEGASPNPAKKGLAASRNRSRHIVKAPSKSKKFGLGPGTSPNAAITLDDSEEEDNFRVKKELKKEVEELLYGVTGPKTKAENTRRTRLCDIAPEPAHETIDSQSNGYVAPDPRDVISTDSGQKESEEMDTEEDHSEYEYENMA